jgi:hypothetical protein
MTLAEKVIKGAWYWITDNKPTREMAANRQAICKHCSHREGLSCGLCGCFIKLKTRLTEEECPDQKW